LALFLVDFLFQ